MKAPNIYDSNTVKSLFDEMSSTYGLMNLITSFGFTYFWRKTCVSAALIKPGDTVFDLMTGMGELFEQISEKLEFEGKILAVDFSHAMCKKAIANANKVGVQAKVIEDDVLTFTFEESSADIVVSSFGLKTLDAPQLRQLALVIFKLLKKGGRFSLTEISVPENRLLRSFFLFYLKKLVPLIGKLFLGNPNNYRQLAIYTEKFGSCKKILYHFIEAGFDVSVNSHFWGCATSVIGKKT